MENKELPLLGAKVCCTSLDYEVKDQVHEAAILLGASTTLDLTMDVTHLVVGNTTSQKYRYVAKNSPDVHVLQPEFFKEIRLKYIAGEDINLDTFHRQYQAPPLLGLRISSTGYVNSGTRDSLIKVITDNGAEYSPDLDRTVSHLIANEPSGKKYAGAPALGVRVVAQEWLFESIKRGMALEESYFNVLMPPKERGLGSWNRSQIQKRFTSNKRQADSDQPGPRKLRRVLSTKLSAARDSIWADIQIKPAPEENKITDHQQLEKSKVDLPKIDKPTLPWVEEPRLIAHKIPSGIFEGTTIYLHGFTSSKREKLYQFISSRGGLVFSSDQAIAEHGESEWPDIYLLTPHDQPINNLPATPSILDRAIRITEWWVEASIFRNSRLDPSDYPLCKPFYRRKIPGFRDVIISSTSFTDEQPAMLKDAIELLGGTYDEYLKPSCSVLISKISKPNKDKTQFAKEHNIPIVSFDWLWACVEQEQIVAYDKYLLLNNNRLESTKSKDSMSLPSELLKSNSNSNDNQSLNGNSNSNGNGNGKSIIIKDAEKVLSENPQSPLKEISAKKLNSPQRSPKRIPLNDHESLLEQPATNSPKSVSVVSEILAARYAARENSLPNSADGDNLARRKRTLGRAPSLRLNDSTHAVDNGDVEDDDAAEDPLIVPESILQVVSQAVTYGDNDAEEKRKQLLAEFRGEVPVEETVKKKKPIRRKSRASKK